MKKLSKGVVTIADWVVGTPELATRARANAARRSGVDFLVLGDRDGDSAPVVADLPPPATPNSTSAVFNAPAAGSLSPTGRSRDSRLRRTQAIRDRLIKGEAPGQNLPWKEFCAQIRSDAGITKKGRGYSDERIEKETRKIWAGLLRGVT